MKANTWSQLLLQLLFQNLAAAGIGDTNGLQPSGAPGSLYVSLHTTDPGAAGDQTTNEAAYTGYARVAVARSSGGWTLANQTISNAAEIDFPRCTAGNTPVSHAYFGIGTAFGGAGKLLYSGALTYPLNISIGIQPLIPAGQATITES